MVYLNWCFIFGRDEKFVLIGVSCTLLGAATEVAALKKVLAEAEDKAAKERAAHEK